MNKALEQYESEMIAEMLRAQLEEGAMADLINFHLDILCTSIAIAAGTSSRAAATLCEGASAEMFRKVTEKSNELQNVVRMIRTARTASEKRKKAR